MDFEYKQGSKSHKKALVDPLKLAITQFKFSPQSHSANTTKIKPLVNPEINRENIISPHIPKRGLSYRSDREKKLQRLNKHKIVPQPHQLPKAKSQMFMTWTERSNSSKKMYVPVDRLLFQTMKSLNKENPERSKSQKRITPINFDLDLRKNKVQTATRIKSNSPMELLTRKLQWRGREIKRTAAFTSDHRNMRPIAAFKEERNMEKIFLAHLNGWELDNAHNQQFLPGEKLI